MRSPRNDSGGSLCLILSMIHRHGRACPGHPRDAAQAVPVSVDARIKSGHDEIVDACIILSDSML
jgi:hypothetical protein